MPIVAYVTRSGGSQFFQQESGVNVGNAGGSLYTLRKADGTSLGSYRSVAEAIATFNNFHGPNRIYKWERRDLAGDIEQHVCIGVPLAPNEIWVVNANPSQLPNAQPVTSLVQWIEPSLAPGSVTLSDVNTGEIRVIKDLSGNGNTYNVVNPAEQAQLTEDATGVVGQGRPVITFDVATDEYEPVTQNGPVAPATIFVAANQITGGDAILLTGPDDPWSLVLASGFWELDVDGSSISGPAASATTMDIVTIVCRETETLLCVNEVDIGTVPTVIDTGGVVILGATGPSWGGSLGFAMWASGNDQNKILQTERYIRSRYQ